MEKQLTGGVAFLGLLLLWFRVDWGADLFPIRNDPTHFTAIKLYSRLSLFIPNGIKMPPWMTNAEIPANQPIVIIRTFVTSNRVIRNIDRVNLFVLFRHVWR